MEYNGRSLINPLVQQLKNERSSFEPFWRNIADYVSPTRQRFTISNANRGDRKNNKIINSTAVLASRTLRSGMMAGITSPARPWFKLGIPDRDLMEYGPVKYWLQTVERSMHNQFLKSNLYNVLPVLYGDVGNFSVGAVFMEEDFGSVSHFYVFPIGSYWIANDEKLRVRIFYREFRMTVRQVVEKFGRVEGIGKPDFTNISEHVKNQWTNNHLETWVDICHIVKPNPEYDPTKLESKYKKYISLYYEKGRTGESQTTYLNDVDSKKFLSKRGYSYFPVLVPRWETTGEDVYGTDCPGMAAFGDNRALQTMERRHAQAVEKIVNPPMMGPAMLRNQKASILPGDITFLDVRDGQQGFKPVHEINARVSELDKKMQVTEMRIQRAYYEDLFLMLSQSDRREITAREIDERHEEKLLMLGPVLEQLNQDLLDPLIDNQFAFGEEQGRFPEPPPELQGMDLKVEYVSVMAQAQKLAGIANIERFAGFAVNMATQTQNPELLDKVNFDQMIDVYGDRLGVDVDLINTDEEVAEKREADARALQMQSTMQTISQGASAAKELSKADLEKDNALKRIIEGGS